MKSIKSQVSIEYLIIVGFITFVISGILAIAFIYSGTIRSQIRINQIENCAEKIIATAESVFYAGDPSKSTIKCYLPEGIQNFQISDNQLVFTVSTSTGTNIIAFSSNVEISGTLELTEGINNIQIEAQTNQATISRV